MTGADFYTAAIPEPVILLGVRLRPFSLGHHLLLNRFGNAYGTGARPELADLIQAIIICSQDYNSAMADLDNPALPNVVATWQRSLQPRNWLGRRKSELGFSPRGAAERFAHYVAAGSRFPLFTVDEAKIGAGLSVPFVQSVKVALQSKMHFTEAELLNRPWGLCLWDYFTLHAAEGNCRIQDREEWAELQAKADASHDRIVSRAKLN